ncbi:hypothetical protein PDK30_24890, partial [Bacillus cereus]|nr:hypothetical protein [Bacillus cereus]
MNFKKVILDKDNNEMVNIAYSIYHSNPEYFQIVSGKTPTRGTVRKMRIYNAKPIFKPIPPFLTTL